MCNTEHRACDVSVDHGFSVAPPEPTVECNSRSPLQLGVAAALALATEMEAEVICLSSGWEL